MNTEYIDLETLRKQAKDLIMQLSDEDIKQLLNIS